MIDAPDAALFEQFARNDSEEAFTEIVRRHIGLVHSVALRHTQNSQHAEEITQAVFIILARKASSLSRKTILSGWLYHTARLTAANFQRAEFRRARREQEVFMQSPAHDEQIDSAWRDLGPLLEEAMSKLGTTDRDAIVLRFFENKSLREVGTAMGLEERAAQKRVARGLEKLRAFFTKRGVVLTGAVIAGAVSAHSVQAAPTGLIGTVSATVAKGTAATSTLTLVKGVLKIMSWTKTKIAFASIITVGAASGATALYVAATHPSPAAELKFALHIPKPATGDWQYPSTNVWSALKDYGTNLADAFPILELALHDRSVETRRQAVSALGDIGMPSTERWNHGPAAPNVTPLLWKILNDDDRELNDLALSSLRSIHFQPEDIPKLADFLVRTHARNLTRAYLDTLPLTEQQKLLYEAQGDQQMQRYLPEAIAETILRDPPAAGPFVPSVEKLLDDSDFDIQFGAACALAEYKGVDDPKISAILAAGLLNPDPNPVSGNGLKPLMAIETLQRIGPKAKSLVPQLLEYARSPKTDDPLLRQVAFKAAGRIDDNLKGTIPEVAQALNNPDLP